MRPDRDRFRQLAPAALAAVLLVILGPPARGGEPLFAGYGASSRGAIDEPMKAKRVETLDLSFSIPNDFVDRILGQGAQTAVACTFQASNDGRPQRGVKVRASGTLAVSGFAPLDLGPVRGRTDSDGVYGVTFIIEVPGPVGTPINIEASFDPAGNRAITSWGADCFGLVNAE